MEALYPKPRLSVPGAPDDGAKRSPYLLRGVTVARRDHVWSTDITDITYVRLQHGFLYLVAVLDWYSRYVLAWELSNTAVQYARHQLLSGGVGGSRGSTGTRQPSDLQHRSGRSVH